MLYAATAKGRVYSSFDMCQSEPLNLMERNP